MKDLLPPIMAFYSAICFIGFIIGMLGGIDSTNKELCTYESLAGRTNLGYVAGCELFRERFKTNY